MPWACSSCTIENEDDNAARCDCCGEPRVTRSQETGGKIEIEDEDDHVDHEDFLEKNVKIDFQKDDQPKFKETVNVEDQKMRSNLAVMLKEQGNEHFKKGDWKNAIKFYSNALEHDKSNPHLHLNKAACYLKLNDTSSAISCSETALLLTLGKNVKAWFRRGSAFQLKKDFFSAYYDFMTAKILDPSDQGVKNSFENMEKKVREIIQRGWKEVDEFEKLDEDLTQMALEPKEDKIDLSVSTINKKLSTNQLIGFFYLLRGNQSIKTLDLSDQKINVIAAIAIRKFLENNKTLQNLILSNGDLGAEGIHQIGSGIIHTMQSLKINGNYCRAFGAAYLRKTCHFISEIDISNNCISDQGLSEILSETIHEDSRLKTLIASQNGITSDSISRLIHRLNTSSLGSLKSLDLSTNLLNPMQILEDRAKEQNIKIITSFTEQTNNPFTNTAIHFYED